MVQKKSAVKPAKKVQTGKKVKSPSKKIEKKSTKSQGVAEQPQKPKVNWEVFPDEEPNEKEYLDEDYPETDGFGKEKEEEVDYEKLPKEETEVTEE